MMIAPHRVGQAARVSPNKVNSVQIVQFNIVDLNRSHASSESYVVRASHKGSKAVLGSLVRLFAGLAPREVKA